MKIPVLFAWCHESWRKKNEFFSPQAQSGNGGTRDGLIFCEDLSANEPLTDRAALAAGHIGHPTLAYTRLGN